MFGSQVVADSMPFPGPRDETVVIESAGVTEVCGERASHRLNAFAIALNFTQIAACRMQPGDDECAVECSRRRMPVARLRSHKILYDLILYPKIMVRFEKVCLERKRDLVLVARAAATIQSRHRLKDPCGLADVVRCARERLNRDDWRVPPPKKPFCEPKCHITHGSPVLPQP